MIETARLRLRRWRPADLKPYAALWGDPRTADWLGGVKSPVEAERIISANEASFDARGYGRFAVERREDGRFLGHCGLLQVHPEIPFAPAVEIGWALAPESWGRGYAVEAARAAIEDGFGRLGLPEIVTYTTPANLRSQAVMTRLGFSRDPTRDFQHPVLPAGHPLRPHIVFALRRKSP